MQIQPMTDVLLDQFKKLESLYCKLHRGKLFMWHHLVAKCKNKKASIAQLTGSLVCKLQACKFVLIEFAVCK